MSFANVASRFEIKVFKEAAVVVTSGSRKRAEPSEYGGGGVMMIIKTVDYHDMYAVMLLYNIDVILKMGIFESVIIQ
jgi:hypothetical protein